MSVYGPRDMHMRGPAASPTTWDYAQVGSRGAGSTGSYDGLRDVSYGSRPRSPSPDGRSMHTRGGRVGFVSVGGRGYPTPVIVVSHHDDGGRGCEGLRELINCLALYCLCRSLRGLGNALMAVNILIVAGAAATSHNWPLFTVATIAFFALATGATTRSS